LDGRERGCEEADAGGEVRGEEEEKQQQQQMVVWWRRVDGVSMPPMCRCRGQWRISDVVEGKEGDHEEVTDDVLINVAMVVMVVDVVVVDVVVVVIRFLSSS
jgi:hypothetical protein